MPDVVTRFICAVVFSLAATGASAGPNADFAGPLRADIDARVADARFAGSRHEYSNYGYILLGRVIEVVSGRPYDEYVRDYVFAPSGMTSTGNAPEDMHVAALAVPYSRGRDGGALRSAEDTLPYRGTSAGGGYTTGGDLLKFAAALQSNKLLPSAATERLLAGKVDTPFRGLRYAYGFEDVQLPDGRHRVGHGGGAPGINAVLSIYPDSGDVVVVLSNLDPPAAIDIDRSIGRALSPG